MKKGGRELPSQERILPQTEPEAPALQLVLRILGVSMGTGVGTGDGAWSKLRRASEDAESGKTKQNNMDLCPLHYIAIHLSPSCVI